MLMYVLWYYYDTGCDCDTNEILGVYSSLVIANEAKKFQEENSGYSKNGEFNISEFKLDSIS